MEPHRVADDQCPGRRGVAGPGGQGLPDGPAGPGRRRGCGLVDRAARRAARRSFRPGAGQSRSRGGARGAGAGRGAPAGRRLRRHERQRRAGPGRRRRGGRHAAGGGAATGARGCPPGRDGSRPVTDRQRAPRPRPAGDRPRAGRRRRLTDPVHLRSHRLEWPALRPVPLHLPLGGRRLHRPVVGPARRGVLRRLADTPARGAHGPAGRRRRDPRAGRHVPGWTGHGGAAPGPRGRRSRASSWPAPGATRGGRRPWRVPCRVATRRHGHSWTRAGTPRPSPTPCTADRARPVDPACPPDGSSGRRGDHLRPPTQRQRGGVGMLDPRRADGGTGARCRRRAPEPVPAGAGAPPPRRRREAGAGGPLPPLGLGGRGNRGDRRGRRRGHRADPQLLAHPR